MQGRVLAIAGSDSSGGAGLQADIKAISAMGAYAATAVTAVTVQNTLGIEAVHKIPGTIIEQQIISVLSDIGADAIKIGMLNDSETVLGVADSLSAYFGLIPIVLDPVMAAKSGASLLSHEAVHLLKSELVSKATLLTPNIPEAEVLTGLKIGSVDDMSRAAKILLSLGADAVLVKGGHLPSRGVSDVLVSLKGTKVFDGPRIDTRHTHGTGCTLASAIAAGLAQKLPLNEAVSRARDYVVEAIRAAPGFGKGHGPLNHFPGNLLAGAR